MPTARIIIAAVRTNNAVPITWLVLPILATSGIKKALPAKQTIESEVRKESAKELSWYSSFKIGINGLMIAKPVRIFIAVINIGKLLRIASRLFMLAAFRPAGGSKLQMKPVEL